VVLLGADDVSPEKIVLAGIRPPRDDALRIVLTDSWQLP